MAAICPLGLRDIMDPLLRRDFTLGAHACACYLGLRGVPLTASLDVLSVTSVVWSTPTHISRQKEISFHVFLFMICVYLLL